MAQSQSPRSHQVLVRWHHSICHWCQDGSMNLSKSMSDFGIDGRFYVRMYIGMYWPNVWIYLRIYVKHMLENMSEYTSAFLSGQKKSRFFLRGSQLNSSRRWSAEREQPRQSELQPWLFQLAVGPVVAGRWLSMFSSKVPGWRDWPTVLGAKRPCWDRLHLVTPKRVSCDW